MSNRTFKIDTPVMHGDDVKEWQRTLNDQMRTWNVNYRLKEDGRYRQATRDLTASVAYGLGVNNPAVLLKNGLTPDIRSKLRNKDQTPAEKKRYDERAGWRKRFRERHEGASEVHTPIARILSSSWGFHRGVHDGVDLICIANAPLFAICDAQVIDVRAGGWWGKAPSGDVRKGDGIIQLKCLTDVGPFKSGMHFGYGHAEGARVKVGQRIKAGHVIGRAGLAVAWHVHFMANGGGTKQGVGDRDPMPYVNYAIKH